MDLRELIRIVTRWLWLILLGGIVGGVSTYYFSIYQQPIYSATTEVFVTLPQYNQLSELGYYNGYLVLQTYVELMVADQVLEETSQRVGYSISENQISVEQVIDTQIITITVENPDPNRAAEFANTLALVFGEQQYQAQTARYAESKQNLEANLAEQRAAIDQTLIKLAELPDTEENKVERELLNLNLTQANDTYRNLLNNYEYLRLEEAQSVSTIQIAETAKPATAPVRPNILTNTLLGIVVGMMLAGGIIFLIEYLDDTVRSPEEIAKLFDLSPLGYIARLPLPRDRKDNGGVYVLQNPRSPISEAFRSLRTNIEFAGVVDPINTILITSPGPREGKSTVAANLATVMMQGGKKVIVVDADLRRPRIHKFFGLTNRLGLSGIFRGQVNLVDAAEKLADNLHVITSGPPPPNPAELLGSMLMDKILSGVSQRADIVIVDSPPVVVTDPIVLSRKVDGVILVINPGKTKKDALKAAMEQLTRAEARILGIVINQIGKRSSQYYQYYYTKSYYHQTQN
ncbi:MAG: polysaccharide biosynthesis tyrosine autokinase [Anaerolineales bacterium]|nr:polysaccharide biosynthesis tyrosine autokinase [Anaerolineales bacterium]